MKLVSMSTVCTLLPILLKLLINLISGGVMMAHLGQKSIKLETTSIADGIL
jgi:hypothetical protein